MMFHKIDTITQRKSADRQSRYIVR